MALCVFQQQRAVYAQARMAEVRGHQIDRAAVFPSFANHVSWRAVYQSGGRYYVDQVRAECGGRTCVSPGTSVPVVGPLDLTGLAPAVVRGERLIRWFSDDWVAYDPDEPEVLGDLRYALEPGGVRPVWGIRRMPWQQDPGHHSTGHHSTGHHSTGQPAALLPALGVQWVNNNAEREVSRAAFVSLALEDSIDAQCF